jgi:ATP-dependent RNA helicase DDX51/DBP6
MGGDRAHDAAAGKPAPPAGGTGPVLPWMKVPITIEAGTGVALEDVGGLDPRLRKALEQGAPWWLGSTRMAHRAFAWPAWHQ